MSKKTLKWIALGAAAAGAAAAAGWLSNKLEEKKELDRDNQYLSEAAAPVPARKGFYFQRGKRILDTVTSFCGLIVLSPVYAILSLAVFIDDPGPVLFSQKRVGKNKKFFLLHKFRSMKMSTPHDIPTHQLDNPEQYITRVGRFLRKTSLDELPQIWDIFRGKMSVIGPRPALWNQEDLVAERDKYGANDVMPGLTGWAQINGRDELEIPDKARLDGEYVEKQSFGFDLKCFLGTISSVARSDGVVEGGTGELHKGLRPGVPERDPEPVLGCDKTIEVDTAAERSVLITGAGSYIGESFRAYAAAHYPNLRVDAVDMIDGSWREKDFSPYDTIYHIAGIAHADVGSVTEEEKEKYYEVNTDLAIETARKARDSHVRQFILMSSMIVYGDSAPFGKPRILDRNSRPAPANFYGDSKWQSDKGIRALETGDFKVAVLRPPMVYGRGSKGNYPVLAKLAKKCPVFPDVNNQRSMIHIDNLCEFLCKLSLSGENGVFFPQNGEYTRTSEMVRLIGEATGRKILLSRIFNPAVAAASLVPGKIGGLVNKAFGNNCYDQALSTYTFSYRVNDLKRSIELTEK